MATKGIFGPMLKLSRWITLHLYNASVPSLDPELGMGVWAVVKMTREIHSTPL